MKTEESKSILTAGLVRSFDGPEFMYLHCESK